jgi:DNA modification methylase
MAIKAETITDNYAIYNGDCVEVMRNLPDECIDMSIYSPPFAGLYNYSSDVRDMSNCNGRDDFLHHYEFCVREKTRITKTGRFTSVHCTEIPKDGANIGALYDFPGDIIRLHERLGWELWARRLIWKEPLAVRNRTMAKGLAHRQICEDASLTGVACGDYLLEFRKKGDNAVPVSNPTGLHRYAGETTMPRDLLHFKGMEGDQKKNRFSHWIWRRYASCIWDDIRIDRVLPYKESKDPEDEKHVHPLQLDVIERGIILRTNPGETVLTPFLGVGSEAYGAIINGRKAVGAELKSSYYSQAVKNCAAAIHDLANGRDQMEFAF